ncbi:MAG: hypothetical protein KAT62_05370 [Desulfuromonadales bacterium]|nr:hypothetical protein [Desulfuromonadales bacterium]
MSNNIESVRAALKERSQDLLARSNVVATGVGYKFTGGKRTDTPCIVCSVEKKIAASALSSQDLVPKDVQGIPTDVVETGVFRVFQAPTGRFRPAPGGVSIGHKDITAGTLGCWVKRNDQWHILSNNHVMANSNNAQTGDPILQPGPHDGGRNPDDQIATLTDFVPVQMTGLPSDCNVAGRIVRALNKVAEIISSDTRLQAVKALAGENLVDAAIARPLNDADVKAEILGIGEIQGLTEGLLGMKVKKSGRTTEFTEDEITQVDVTVNVQYGAGLIATFKDQLMAGPMSQGGDSGSAVLDENSNLVGLLFAGSDQTTIFNRIQNVFSALRLTL